MKQLLAITDPGCAASTRYRVAQFEPYFRSRGIQLEIFPCPRETSDLARMVETVALADVVVIQRYLPRSALLKNIRRHARRLVYDFDDAVIYGESAHSKPGVKLTRWWRFRRMLRGCDAVTAGNTYLAGLAGIHADRKRLFTVPTVVDLERYEREPSTANTELSLGWIGGRWTLPYLEAIRQPLEKLSFTHPGLVLKVIADQSIVLGKVPVRLVPWDKTTEVRDLKSLKAGLAPLPDDVWTRGKCGLRLLQYLAAGIPAIASPVGVQAEIIRHGGALPAGTDAAWQSGISKVLTNPDAAAQLAVRGKEVIREYYHLATWAPRLFEAWCG